MTNDSEHEFIGWEHLDADNVAVNCDVVVLWGDDRANFLCDFTVNLDACNILASKL